jgi:predicted dinucleotide-binding enzyme
MGSSIQVRRVLAALLVVASLGPIVAYAEPARETVAVIGTGKVGGALGPRLAELGYPVVYGSRDPAGARPRELAERSRGARTASPREAAAAAGIVILAMPWSAARETLRGLGDLSGKIVIDVTNAFERGPDGLMRMVVPTSGGELIQSWVPRARVVKAFNTMQWKIMARPALARGPVSVPLCGDDESAKLRVAGLVRELGFAPTDVGPMRHSRWLEGMTILYLTPSQSGRPQDSFEFYFSPRPRVGS